MLQPKSRNYFVQSINTRGKQLPTVIEEQTHSYSEFSHKKQKSTPLSSFK